jgi:selenide,water dikinase
MFSMNLEKNKKIRLTQSVSCAGCAAKLSPMILRQAVKNIPQVKDPNLLVGYDHADDAGVYLLKDGKQALVQTVDFFTPIVDDPFTYGQVAAANALSDVYAMGGTPLTALNVFCAPEDMSPEVIGEILKGGADKLREAGCVLVGGHSVKDKELKFGMAVTGLINPKKVLSNDKSRVGDVLVLTKPLGTGIITTAAKNNDCPPKLLKKAIEQMSKLNKKACLAMLKHDAHSCTDVTGFSLMGHLSEMTRASGVKARVFMSKVPRYDGINKLIEDEYFTRGGAVNREYAMPYKIDKKISEIDQHLIFDPQTSGGLLVSLTSKDADRFVKDMKSQGESAWIVGEILKKDSKGFIEVVV